MKNPLRKRLLRELKSEFGKYMVIFLLLVGSIGFVSGFLVADGSMIAAYEESFEKYNIEDGNFLLEEKANKAQKKTIQEGGVTLYDNFYLEEKLENGSTLRVFRQRDQVNRVCLMDGELPEQTGEIAIDRMYGENNGIEIGDVLRGEAYSWKVTGIIALPDYSCLFSDNNDSMFDSVKFGVSLVSPEEFELFDEEDLYYSYSWKYHQKPKSEAEEKEMSEELMKTISREARLTAFVPCYLNQAIQFTGDDMGKDRVMMMVLLYMIIVILAFVYAVIITNTIAAEANVIGTLRASGYTRRELVGHYITAPMAVTGAGAVAGNLLGYTVFKDVCAGMYYGSYSLTTYVTIWNGEAFLLTTVVPTVLMFVINLLILHRKLKLSPLRFLRRETGGRKKKRAVRLHKKLPFFGRFRLRVIFQNMGNYGILLVGILFANLLLMFGMMFPSVLAHYQSEMEHNLLCNYQYLLKVPAGMANEERKLESLLSMMFFMREAETENDDAEKFSAYALQTMEGKYKSEEVLLYGIREDSRYVKADVSGQKVCISSAYADKYGLGPGDTLVLKEAYEETRYEFQVTGVYDYDGAIALFMEQEELNRIFDLGDEYFSGYFSDTEITDIDEKYVGTVIDLEALTKISRQLNVSMGSMMYLVDGFAVAIFMILIYLLSKIIIEKNAQSISMAKILGYTNGEIGRLYIMPTSILVVLFLLLSLPIEYELMGWLFREIMLSSISGWIPFYVDPMVFVKMIFLGIGTYALVAALEYRKIRQVPMDEALKNVE